MAGIAFEVQRLMRRGGLLGKAEAYTYAAAVGSGPWVLSICALLLIGMLTGGKSTGSQFVDTFQVCVTYMMAASLVMTGALQLAFARFIADRLYSREANAILPNLLGALLVVMGTAGVVGSCVLGIWFDGSLAYKQLLLAGVVTLCGIWIVMVFASAIKAYRQVLLSFLAGYGLTVGGALALEPFGIEGMLLGFALGQSLLLFLLLGMVANQYPSELPVSFAFLRKPRLMGSLMVAGLLYNGGIWIDKLVFWLDSGTGISVIGPLRASPIYDLPIFLSYLSLVPGMAVFLVRIELDFAGRCAAFIRTIEDGATLAQVLGAKASLVESIRRALVDVLLTQMVTAVVFIAFTAEILAVFGISPLYRALLWIDLVAVGLQMMVLIVLNVLFYLDEPRSAQKLCAIFAVSNLLFSWASLHAGPAFYGYGFASAGLLTAAIGLVELSRKLARLEYRTFMLQPAHY